MGANPGASCDIHTDDNPHGERLSFHRTFQLPNLLLSQAIKFRIQHGFRFTQEDGRLTIVSAIWDVPSMFMHAGALVWPERRPPHLRTRSHLFRPAGCLPVSCRSNKDTIQTGNSGPLWCLVPFMLSIGIMITICQVFT